MLWILIYYSLITFFTYQASGLPAHNFTNAIFREEAFPNPLVVPWGNARYYCARNNQWMTADWSRNDCALAIQKFHDIEVTPKRGTVYEFVQAGGRQQHPSYYGQAMPREYTGGKQRPHRERTRELTSIGTCTMGVVMMNDPNLGNVRKLVPGKIPGNRAYAATDFATYMDMWWAATQLYQLCSLNYDSPGWLPIGQSALLLIQNHPSRPFSIFTLLPHRLTRSYPGINGSIGIFLYPTSSGMDKQINGTQPSTTISDHLPSGWTYYGCNYDDSQNRALGNLSWSGQNLSVQRCADYCEEYKYMGVEFGEE
ncbi:MAG: hypothetical protein Q9218_004253 [Villophora microphyllina]